MLAYQKKDTKWWSNAEGQASSLEKLDKWSFGSGPLLDSSSDEYIQPGFLHDKSQRQPDWKSRCSWDI